MFFAREPGKSGRSFTIIFLAVVVTVVAAACFYYENERREIKKQFQDELLAVSNLKISQVREWRRERMSDAYQIFNDPFLANRLSELSGKTSLPEQDRQILQWIAAFLVGGQYERIFVLDEKGLTRLSAPALRKENPSGFQAPFAKAKESEKILFSGPYRDEESQRVVIDLLVPILLFKKGETSVVGALVLRSDPYQSLYPLLQSWPTPRRTSEILLVRREKDEVVFLNEPLHWKNAVLTLRFPVGKEDLPAAMVVQGKQGLTEGRDYRGKNVFASVWAIPDSPWSLIAKVDEKEVYSRLWGEMRFVIVLAGILIVTSGVILVFIWRHQVAVSRMRRHELELQRQALARHYGSLTKFANDIIFLIDQEARIVEINDRAVELYGYSREELLGMTVRDLRSPEEMSSFAADFQRVVKEEKLMFETRHRRKDGSDFPVEISTRILGVEGKTYHQAIIRDISERKRMEEERERMIAKLQNALSKVNALSGLLPICASCKKIRDDKGYWNQIESYLRDHSEAEFSHGICPECLKRLYPDFSEDEDGKQPDGGKA